MSELARDSINETTTDAPNLYPTINDVTADLASLIEVEFNADGALNAWKTADIRLGHTPLNSNNDQSPDVNGDSTSYERRIEQAKAERADDREYQGADTRDFEEEFHFFEITFDQSILKAFLTAKKHFTTGTKPRFLGCCLDSGAARNVVGKENY